MLARVVDALTQSRPSGGKPYSAAMYSIAGNAKAMQGGATPFVLDSSGAPRFFRYAQLKQSIANLTGGAHSFIMRGHRGVI